jgi:hypothetical protein
MRAYKAYKRITVEFTHEVEGQRQPETMDFVEECNTGRGYGLGVFESLVVGFLEQSGLVKPQFVSLDQHLSEPPLFDLWPLR